jgi:uncharacterized Zn-binding protein involved in type VI secretion
LGDSGIGLCPKHIPIPQPYVTVFNIGSPNVLINGLNAVTVDPLPNGAATCGDVTRAVTGSATVFINGKPVHRLGDIGVNFGSYTVTVASPDVLVG